jgi:transposase-like protein
MTRDSNAIVYAPSLQEARKAREHFVRKWRALSSEVVKSLEEAGPELLTFYDFPQSPVGRAG